MTPMTLPAPPGWMGTVQPSTFSLPRYAGTAWRTKATRLVGPAMTLTTRRGPEQGELPEHG
jgi:hypothetical protein